MTDLPPEQARRCVVIPSFNQHEETTRCVSALLGGGGGDFRAIVVDHGTEKWNPPPQLSARLEVVPASPDLWWTGATNTGIRHALQMGAQSVMLLNADCVLESATAAALFAASEEDGAVVAPVQRSLVTNRVVSAGTFPLIALGFPTLFERTDLRKEPPRRIIIRGGRGAVVPKGVFHDIGLFAEDALPHYLADHDFYLRCRRTGAQIQIRDDLSVLVDDASTSIAAKPGQLSWREFTKTLTSERSHRNLTAIRPFFKRNYPIAPLHFVGTSLYLVRYFASWALHRVVVLARNALPRRDGA